MSIAQSYPRLLTCDLSFTTLLAMNNALSDYLQIDEDLAGRLSEPLKEIKSRV